MDTITFTKTAPPEWLLAMWKEIDDKTFGEGFDCFADDAICNLGVADCHDAKRSEIISGSYRQGPYRASRFCGVLGQPLAEGLSW
jgi:hypothetical protein